MNKSHDEQLGYAKHKFTHVNKWISNEQLHHKFSNRFWTTEGISNAQITQHTKIYVHLIHGELSKKHILATNTPNPKFYVNPKA